MSSMGVSRNVVGVALAVVLMLCWACRDTFTGGLGGSGGASASRRGMETMQVGATEAHKRKEARADFEAALKLDARDPMALFGLGWVEQLDGNGERAKELYAGSIRELQDLLHAARYNQSLVLEQRGDLRAAYEEIRLLLRVDPQHEKARSRQEDLIRKMGFQGNK